MQVLPETINISANGMPLISDHRVVGSVARLIDPEIESRKLYFTVNQACNNQSGCGRSDNDGSCSNHNGCGDTTNSSGCTNWDRCDSQGPIE